MKNTQPFILDDSGLLFECPDCHNNTLARYVYTVDEDYAPDTYGVCQNRERCGYELNPFADGLNLAMWKYKRGLLRIEDFNSELRGNAMPPVIPSAAVEYKSLPPDRNALFNSLVASGVPRLVVLEAFKRYRVGTNTTFHLYGKANIPVLDFNGQCRLLLTADGEGNESLAHASLLKKANELGVEPPSWAIDISAHRKRGGVAYPTLFGSHVLRNDDNPLVNLVVCPHTALIASMYLPGSTWCAIGNFSSFTIKSLELLKGRAVTAIPSATEAIGGYTEMERWQMKATELKLDLLILPTLELLATPQQRSDGWSLDKQLAYVGYEAIKQNHKP